MAKAGLAQSAADRRLQCCSRGWRGARISEGYSGQTTPLTTEIGVPTTSRTSSAVAEVVGWGQMRLKGPLAKGLGFSMRISFDLVGFCVDLGGRV